MDRLFRSPFRFYRDFLCTGRSHGGLLHSCSGSHSIRQAVNPPARPMHHAHMDMHVHLTQCTEVSTAQVRQHSCDQSISKDPMLVAVVLVSYSSSERTRAIIGEFRCVLCQLLKFRSRHFRMSWRQFDGLLWTDQAYTTMTQTLISNSMIGRRPGYHQPLGLRVSFLKVRIPSDNGESPGQ
jgi:hypothetical protein